SDNQSTGLSVAGTDAVVADNQVHDSRTGIDVSGDRLAIQSNRVWDNSDYGIDAYAYVGAVTDNEVFQTFVYTSTNAATGITLHSGSLLQDHNYQLVASGNT